LETDFQQICEITSFGSGKLFLNPAIKQRMHLSHKVLAGGCF
jgi:hypothetical protein